MQRTVFEKFDIDGFRTSKVETLALAASGQRLFVGTSDGSMILYDATLGKLYSVKLRKNYEHNNSL
jgi:hypothetical protein